MPLSTSNLHFSSSSISLFGNNKNTNSPKPFLLSFKFTTSNSPYFIAPLELSTTNHSLTYHSSSNQLQSHHFWLQCVSEKPHPSTSVVIGGISDCEERVIVLVIGGGGREHALSHALKQSPSCDSVLCAPGNSGITSSGDATCIPELDISNSLAVISFCQTHNVGLVFIG